MKRFLAHSTLFLFLLIASACIQGALPTTQAQQTACQPGVAEIQVGDGYLSNLCGCQEGQIVVQAGQMLTCTLSADTVVFFEFTGTQLEHQIIPTGTPAIPASPLSYPADTSIPQLTSYPVTLTAPGTYSFQDAFESSLTGELIVL